MKVRAHLAWMALAILIPFAAFAVAGLLQLLKEEEDSAQRSVRETSRAIAQAVDRELENAETLLRVLATSVHLAKGDLPNFYQQAVQASFHEDAWVLLFDRDGNQLINTRVPFGTPLARRTNPERVTEVMRTQRSSVSDLYQAALLRKPVVAVDVPVPLDGGQRYVLTQIFPAEFFDRTFAQRDLPRDWIVAIRDGAGIAIARSHRASEFVGKLGDPKVREAARLKAEGMQRLITREGIPALNLFTRSARSGWYVAIAVPTQAMEAPARRAVAMVGLGLLAAATAGVGVAYLFSRRLTHSITGAMQGAAALGRGEMPVVMPSAVTEIGELNRALADAGTVLANEQEARSRAEAERERLLASEQAARAAAEAQNQAKDEFLAMLGHELRNPLSAISGAVAVMAMSDDNAVLTRHSREVISRQSKHLARIVDDLLDLSRVMTGKIMLHRQRVDLGDAARKCIATLGAAGRSARHEVSIAAEPVLVEADATRLDQIISNLLVNAFKYTPEKGSVAVEVRREGDDAVLVVRDSGIGISAQLLPRVFEIFFQGSATLDRAQGGLGIGLALVHRLVNLHGGSVSAASEGTDRGSTFTVRLPALDSARADETLADAELPAFKAKRLLVVDDHDDARITLCRVLELSGHRVLEGRDGAEGLRIAAAELPDVAIIDIGLPGMDGYEMARQLRAQPATRGIMLIALTGYGLQDDRRRSREAGFDVHLVKPADPERIAAAIAST